MFNLKASFKPTGDQPQAIDKLVYGVNSGLKNQVLLGVTGSGKTFTMANVIQKLNKPTLIISHNKTLAGQLYQEMREFFPNNAIGYFVSYYDYYQPEAYIATTDTYIEKEAEINELIDKLRLQATTNILTRNDVIIVASVSCIYNIGSPLEYGRYVLMLEIGQDIKRHHLFSRLAQLQYEKSEFDFKRGTFRERGENIDIYPAYEDFGYRIKLINERIVEINKFEPLTGKIINNETTRLLSPSGEAIGGQVKQFSNVLNKIIIYPAKHYMTNPDSFDEVEKDIRHDLKIEYQLLKDQNKLIEAERLLKRTNYDLEIIKEVGYVNGIENYSRYFDGRNPGDRPHSLIDYYKQTYNNDFLVFIDESHMTVPQLRGMYNGDNSRKKMLIDFGFRLKASYDNRPLKFDEFYEIVPKIIYTSATPNSWEIEQAKTETKLKRIHSYNGIVEQLLRPTGIIDPKIIIKKAVSEVIDLEKEIQIRVKKGEKVLVTALTKRNAEDLTDYLKEKNIKASYLHSDIQTLERSDILDNLRKNEFDVLIGVNLLREGLDLPEVSLVAILDADKMGFLRSKTSLIQTMGRAARNIKGEVILYADQETTAIKQAIDEIGRRRKYQIEYNKKRNIIPTTIYKPIREKIIENDSEDFIFNQKKAVYDFDKLNKINSDSLTPFDKKRIIKRLSQEMKRQANDLNFELAIQIREKIKELKS